MPGARGHRGPESKCRCFLLPCPAWSGRGDVGGIANSPGGDPPSTDVSLSLRPVETTSSHGPCATQGAPRLIQHGSLLATRSCPALLLCCHRVRATEEPATHRATSTGLKTPALPQRPGVSPSLRPSTGAAMTPISRCSPDQSEDLQRGGDARHRAQGSPRSLPSDACPHSLAVSLRPTQSILGQLRPQESFSEKAWHAGARRPLHRARSLPDGPRQPPKAVTPAESSQA